jgi:GNAT superfamily N-acetyltransferase
MITPRLAKKGDMPQVLDLIKALALFEKEPDAVTITLDTLVEDGFGQYPKFTCFVVEVNRRIIGMALVYPRYSTWKGSVLHLEDLIVHEDYRGEGYGTLLLDAVVQFGKSKQVKRISWEVLNWNTSAISFYEAKGAKILEEWNLVQLDEQGITNYLDSL